MRGWENILEALLWLGWFVFYNGKKICVICWYSGWNFIVHGKVFTFVIKLKVNIISCVKFISFVIMITIIVIVVFDSKPNTQQM